MKASDKPKKNLNAVKPLSQFSSYEHKQTFLWLTGLLTKPIVRGKGGFYHTGTGNDHRKESVR